MYPLLPCRDIDEAIAFYEALGFERTYRQVRPNPSAVVERGQMGIHLFRDQCVGALALGDWLRRTASSARS